MNSITMWLKGFFKNHNRNLDGPDGRALYAYQLKETEFDFLSALLSNSIASKVGCVSFNTGTERLFVLYAAEWFRRRYEGGTWKWEEVFKSLDWPTLSASERQSVRG
ncbi:hypothetical protein [Neptuniibacter marinus]|uniref:hypothetical protein n=1 Tax=Neptuniibacter marinus TaxID=1806670 RepID=UPI003B5BDC27